MTTHRSTGAPDEAPLQAAAALGVLAGVLETAASPGRIAGRAGLAGAVRGGVVRRRRESTTACENATVSAAASPHSLVLFLPVLLDGRARRRRRIRALARHPRSEGLGARDLPARHRHRAPRRRRLGHRALRDRAPDPRRRGRRSPTSWSRRSSRPRTRASTITAASTSSASAGAALRDLATRRMSQGASTLTQQLARAVFLTPEKTFARKINEVFLTVEIEKRFSKDQILTMYLNQISVRARQLRSRGGVALVLRPRPAKTLTLPEAALLAGLIQRPDVLLARPKPGRREEPARLRPPPDGRGGVHRRTRSARPRARRRSRSSASRARRRRPLLLRGGPPVPREGVRRDGALPARACASTRRSTRGSRPGRRTRSAGASGASTGARASASRATSSPKGSTPRSTATRRGPRALRRRPTRSRPSSSRPRRRAPRCASSDEAVHASRVRVPVDARREPGEGRPARRRRSRSRRS